MIEIRLHGRGGQGVVTAAEILAFAAGKSGKYAQSFPYFGVERRGAPVEAFVRIDTKPILLHSQIYTPDMLIVLDPSILRIESTFSGLKKGGLIVANSKDFKRTGFKVVNVDATHLAMTHLGKPITNTAMLGAFAAASKLVKLDAVLDSLNIAFDSKSLQIPDCNEEPATSDNMKENIHLVKEAYKECLNSQ